MEELYKSELMKMLENIHDVVHLRRIYSFTKVIYNKGLDDTRESTEERSDKMN